MSADTRQPLWRMVANLGDVDPIEHDGFFVYTDRRGIYPPEAEVLVRLDTEPTSWQTYRFALESCTYIDGVLSDNALHPDTAVWFADRLSDVARSVDMPLPDMLNGFTSEDPIARAWCWRAVGDYFGYENLDSYPVTYRKRSELPRRFSRAKAVR